jgi:hypothetical protein
MERQILLNLMLSLTLADNMGDVIEDVVKAIKLLGIETPDSVESDEIRDLLELQGAVSLWKPVTAK